MENVGDDANTDINTKRRNPGRNGRPTLVISVCPVRTPETQSNMKEGTKKCRCQNNNVITDG